MTCSKNWQLDRPIILFTDKSFSERRFHCLVIQDLLAAKLPVDDYHQPRALGEAALSDEP